MKVNNEPRYYIAVFGDPGQSPNNKDRVEDGRYITHPDYFPSSVSEGDIILLYCTSSYPGHFQEAPGLGVMLDIDRNNNAIYFRYLPLKDPISMDNINDKLIPDDKQKFGYRRFSTFWIFEITKESFIKIVKGNTINWP